MPAKEHPDAIAAPSLPILACLNVSGHMFGIGDLLVADYDEHSSQQVIKDTQHLALDTLNGGIYKSASSDDYNLGFDGMMMVKLKDTSWKHARDIMIGDVLFSCGMVLGIVKEKCESAVVVDGLHIAAAQLVFDPESKMWTRCLLRYKAKAASVVLYSFITSNCGTIMAHTGQTELCLRDYREVAIPEMEDSYREEFVKHT